MAGGTKKAPVRGFFSFGGRAAAAAVRHVSPRFVPRPSIHDGSRHKAFRPDGRAGGLANLRRSLPLLFAPALFPLLFQAVHEAALLLRAMAVPGLFRRPGPGSKFWLGNGHVNAGTHD